MAPSYASYPQIGTGGPFDFITKPVEAAVQVVTAPVKAVVAVAKGENVVKSLAKIATAPADALASVTSSIPVLGDVTRIANVAALGPLNLATSIASGARIDQAVVANLKAQLKNAKDAAPYAQMVVSLVPGVGPGVSAAMSAGIALAEGRGIDEISKAAIRGALPGGPLVQAGFDAALKVAAGENVGKVALEGARSQLSPAAQKAFDVGLAVATGEKIQTAFAKGLSNLASDQMGAIVAAGQKAIGATPAFANAIKGLSSAATQGSQVAAGLLSQTGLNEKAVTAVRNQLSVEVRQGFDAVLKTQENRLAWLKNVTSGLSETQLAAGRAEAARRAASTRLSPAEQQKYIDYANLQKLAQLTPEQQKQLVEYADAASIRAPQALEPPKKAAPAQAPPRALDPPKKTVVLAPPTKAMMAPAAGQMATPATKAAYAPYPQIGALGDSEVQSPTRTATEVRSPTSTSTEVRSPTSTSTEVRSPTSTSTEAYTQGNFTATVTGGAGAGAETHVHIHAPPLNRENVAHSKGAPITAHENENINAPRPKNPTAQENTSVNAPRPKGPTAQENSSVNTPRAGVGWALGSEEVWGPAIVDMPRHMEWAGRSAVHGSRGRPRKVQGPDGTTYLFAIKNGVLTAQPSIRL